MKCQNLFTGKNMENISKCCLLKLLPRVLSDTSVQIFMIVVIKGFISLFM